MQKLEMTEQELKTYRDALEAQPERQAHVEVHLDRDRPDRNRLVVDGVDLTPNVAESGLHVDVDDGVPRVTLQLLPRTIAVTGDVDLVVETPTDEAGR